MRAVLFVFSGFLVPASLMAQGWIMPRPCVRPMGIEGDAIRNCPPIDASVVCTRSDVRAELVGEADYIFPLPKGAAFQDLKLSINGEMVAGETMNAGEARRIYEEIVRRQRDPALVEWMGHGLLRARIIPINPGEE